MDDRESSILPEDRASLDWLTATFLLGPLAILAELLIVKTHHRPLGAATFASFAVVAWLVGGLVVRGLVRIGGTLATSVASRDSARGEDASESSAEQKSRVLPILWFLALSSSALVFARMLF